MVLGRKRDWGGRAKGGKERGKKGRRKKGREGRKRFKRECCEIGNFLFSVPAVDFGFELLPHIISLVFMGFFLPTLILNAEHLEIMHSELGDQIMSEHFQSTDKL